MMNDTKSFLVNKFNILNKFCNCDLLMTSNFAHQTCNFITEQTLACISHVSLFFYLFLFKHKEVFYTINTKCSYIPILVCVLCVYCLELIVQQYKEYRYKRNALMDCVVRSDVVVTSVSKKLGQTAVLYHYCAVVCPSFFLKQTLSS